MAAGQIIILNGAPRSGKSSIAAAIQDMFDGVWINFGVDACAQITPPRLRPGIGLRPGGERPDLEALVPRIYAALYDSIAAHSRLALNVVTDVGHHDAYSRPLDILSDCARRLAGLPVLFVGVRCPIEVILQRRSASGADGAYVSGSVGDPVPLPVRRWQEEVHRPGIYDLEVDTSRQNPAECAGAIRHRLEAGPEPLAFRKLAQMRARDKDGNQRSPMPRLPGWKT
ncbi:chloramphenicol phosphotransferase CPT family protein [Mesorhizobium tamadayense]|uniref:chloramphenicol phosphotransferase CPT family protein n=1 Tax=Mesorhizobium tamadayense TaxID=425306 RepID=UPI001FE21015|nr:chloramphenicol phosphotransferase [Mesorhizobium tamadayense]